MHILSLYAYYGACSNHYLENSRESCGDTNSIIKCDGRTKEQIHGQTDTRTYDAVLIYMPSASWRGHNNINTVIVTLGAILVYKNFGQRDKHNVTIDRFISYNSLVYSVTS